MLSYLRVTFFFWLRDRSYPSRLLRSPSSDLICYRQTRTSSSSFLQSITQVLRDRLFAFEQLLQFTHLLLVVCLLLLVVGNQFELSAQLALLLLRLTQQTRNFLVLTFVLPGILFESKLKLFLLAGQLLLHAHDLRLGDAYRLFCELQRLVEFVGFYDLLLKPVFELTKLPLQHLRFAPQQLKVP